MKTLLRFLFAAFSLTLLVVSVSPAKSSTNAVFAKANYKHADKLMEARQWESASGIEFRIPKRKPQTITSYREYQRRGGLGYSAIAIPAKPVLMNWNYKQQNGMIHCD